MRQKEREKSRTSLRPGWQGGWLVHWPQGGPVIPEGEWQEALLLWWCPVGYMDLGLKAVDRAGQKMSSPPSGPSPGSRGDCWGRKHTQGRSGGRQRRAVSTKEETGRMKGRKLWHHKSQGRGRSKHVPEDAKQEEGVRKATRVAWWEQKAVCTKPKG